MKTTKELYLEKLKIKSKELKAQISGNEIEKTYAQLEGRAVDEQLELKQKVKDLQQKSDDLDSKIEAAQAKTAEAKNAAEDAWEEVKQSLEKTWADIDSAWSDFKKKITS